MVDQNLTLGDAASRFLADLPAKEREVGRQGVHKFVRWFGQGHPVHGLTAPEVANYAARLPSSEADTGKQEAVKTFLAYARKQGWTKTNLTVHFKSRKVKARPSSGAEKSAPEAFLTAQGRAELQAELDALKGKRPAIIEQIRLAAADKDVRENAPLGAAREQLGHLEGRIKELEQVLKSAGVIGKKDEAGLKVYIGDTVLLHDLASGREVRYTIVSPREVDPVRGKISSASPIGQALIGRRNGEMVEVTAPAGKLRYQVKAIER